MASDPGNSHSHSGPSGHAAPQPGHPHVGETRRMWILMAIIVGLLGIGIGVYSTLHHLEVKASGKTDAACNINETFSCDEVALSKFSEIAGIPLGVFGIGYFLACVVLLALSLRGGKATRENLHAYIVLTGIGIATSVGLAGISIFGLGTYCITCMGVYALTAAQGALILIGRKSLPPGFDVKDLASGGSTAVIAVAATVIVFNTVRPPVRSADQAAEAGKDGPPGLSSQVYEIPVSKSAYAGLGEDYRKGGDQAKVVLVEFADFECPACASIAGTMEQLAHEYGDRILIVFRNYPLDSGCNSAVKGRMHERACKAAVMGRCAGQYGKFWAWHDKAFDSQKDISDDNLRSWGREIGLTDDQISACWDNKDLLAKVQDDIQIANNASVTSTPTLFLNGRKVLGGRGIAELRQEIDRLLQ